MSSTSAVAKNKGYYLIVAGPSFDESLGKYKVARPWQFRVAGSNIGRTLREFRHVVAHKVARANDLNLRDVHRLLDDAQYTVVPLKLGARWASGLEVLLRVEQLEVKAPLAVFLNRPAGKTILERTAATYEIAQGEISEAAQTLFEEIGYGGLRAAEAFLQTNEAAEQLGATSVARGGADAIGLSF